MTFYALMTFLKSKIVLFTFGYVIALIFLLYCDVLFGGICIRLICITVLFYHSQTYGKSLNVV